MLIYNNTQHLAMILPVAYGILYRVHALGVLFLWSTVERAVSLQSE